MEDRELYLQELDTAFYNTVPYWLTYLIIEGCMTTVITTIQMVIFYFMGWCLGSAIDFGFAELTEAVFSFSKPASRPNTLAVSTR